MIKICKRFLMYEMAQDILFNDEGCNFCSELIDTLGNFEFKDEKKR